MKCYIAIYNLVSIAVFATAREETGLRGRHALTPSAAGQDRAEEVSESISIESNSIEDDGVERALQQSGRVLLATDQYELQPVKKVAARPPPPPPPKIITLGDSYSSGTGLYPRGNQYDEEFGGYVSPWKLTSRADNECWRETDSTLAGPKYSNQVNIPSINLACKGAEVDHFENQIDLLNSRYPSNAAYGWDGSTILFTIGGNDIRTRDGEDWPDVLSACILERNCHKENGNQVANWNTIRTRLDAAYDKLAFAAHGAKIRVMGYPRMFQRLTAWYYPDKCPGVTGVNRNEADWADGNINVLNNILRQAVVSARAAHPGLDLEFVSVNGYITRGACRSSGREINDKVCKNTSTDLCFGDGNISDSSFHPSSAGYKKYSDAFVASL